MHCILLLDANNEPVPYVIKTRDVVNFILTKPKLKTPPPHFKLKDYFKKSQISTLIKRFNNKTASACYTYIHHCSGKAPSARNNNAKGSKDPRKQVGGVYDFDRVLSSSGRRIVAVFKDTVGGKIVRKTIKFTCDPYFMKNYKLEYQISSAFAKHNLAHITTNADSYQLIKPIFGYVDIDFGTSVWNYDLQQDHYNLQVALRQSDHGGAKCDITKDYAVLISDYNPNTVDYAAYISRLVVHQNSDTFKKIIRTLVNGVDTLSLAYNTFGFIHGDLKLDNIIWDTVAKKTLLFDFDNSSYAPNPEDELLNLKSAVLGSKEGVLKVSKKFAHLADIAYLITSQLLFFGTASFKWSKVPGTIPTSDFDEYFIQFLAECTKYNPSASLRFAVAVSACIYIQLDTLETMLPIKNNFGEYHNMLTIINAGLIRFSKKPGYPAADPLSLGELSDCIAPYKYMATDYGILTRAANSI